jgi:hypothetical protein
MLTLLFSGWFECRLATDPDPTDEPRGVSGWTSAVAGEPDLDRIIRLQPDGAVNRLHGPTVGVKVRAVSLFGTPQPEHPLLGTPVELLGNPVFEGRNGLAAEDAEEPIFPFHWQSRQGNIVLHREHRDVMSGEFVFDKPVNFDFSPSYLQEATGMTDPRAFRQTRKEALGRSLESCQDLVQRAALQKRIRDIDRLAGSIAESALQFALHYRIVMQGPWVEIRDPKNELSGRVDTTPWIVSFWVGTWDADALCGYMKGQMVFPFQPTIA